MRWRPLSAALFLGLVTLAPGPARAQRIGVFFDLQATQCQRTVPSGTPVTFYVLALLEGQAAAGISGAGFRIEGMPAGWFLTGSTPNCDFNCPDPFTEDAHFAWPLCEYGPVVPILTVNAFATTSVQDAVLTTRKNDSEPLDCPVVVLCDAPTWTAICATGTRAVFNPVNEDCTTVALGSHTWTQLKALYRD